VDEIRADFVSKMSGYTSDSWQFDGIDYRIVDTAGLLSFSVAPTAGPFVGTVSTSSDLPTQVACLVSVKGTTTKPNRARTYLSGLVEGIVTSGLFTSGFLTDMEAFIDLQSALNSGGTNPLQRVAAQWNAGHTQVIVTNNIAGDASAASAIPAT